MHSTNGIPGDNASLSYQCYPFSSPFLLQFWLETTPQQEKILILTGDGVSVGGGGVSGSVNHSPPGNSTTAHVNSFPSVLQPAIFLLQKGFSFSSKTACSFSFHFDSPCQRCQFQPQESESLQTSTAFALLSFSFLSFWFFSFPSFLPSFFLSLILEPWQLFFSWFFLLSLLLLFFFSSGCSWFSLLSCYVCGITIAVCFGGGGINPFFLLWFPSLFQGVRHWFHSFRRVPPFHQSVSGPHSLEHIRRFHAHKKRVRVHVPSSHVKRPHLPPWFPPRRFHKAYAASTPSPPSFNTDSFTCLPSSNYFTLSGILVAPAASLLM